MCQVVRWRWGEITSITFRRENILKGFFLLYKTLAVEDVCIQYCIYVHINIARCPPYFRVSVIVTVNSQTPQFVNTAKSQFSNKVNRNWVDVSDHVQIRPSYIISSCHVLARILVNSSCNSGNIYMDGAPEQNHRYARRAVLLIHPRFKTGLRYVVHRGHLCLLHNLRKN